MNRIFKLIDRMLDSITMYRVVLYSLAFLVLLSFGLAAIHVLPFGPSALLESLLVITAASFLGNLVISKVLRVPVNNESQWITAFILFLILAPPTNLHDLWVPIFVSFVAMLSKYVLAIGKKHIFNPVAISLVILSLFGQGNATWWVGSLAMLPAVATVGILILRKIKRFELFFTFLITSLVSISFFGTIHGMSEMTVMSQVFVSWPILFFAIFMLTEPLTTPPTKILQMLYGAFVGILFGSQFSFVFFGFLFYSSPELALVIGNIFSYLVSPKQKLLLVLKEKKEIADNTFEFIFSSTKKLLFAPGQYLEWTLPHKSEDIRGARRYFTIASSPTESDIRLGIKYFPEQSSSFKKALQNLSLGDKIVASQLAGEFTLPKDISKKLVFIAGGIGITPFRSMIKYLIDSKEKRDVVLFYSNKIKSEIAYGNIFDEATRFGIKTVNTLTDNAVDVLWQGKRGFVTAEMIVAEVPDFKERLFYVSGPHGMVAAFEDALLKIGVPSNQIKVDYFPGFA
jgi:ferredoxin-NADP reductase